MNISNQEFLQAIFGSDFIWAHVTDFFHDPGCEFTDISRKAWLGNHYINYTLHKYANQYFTISLFEPTSDGQARRRKELFKATYCIVIDDVGEKINPSLLFDKPAPSWILETSPGSQQWGYILDEPCYNRQKVESLLQGIVAKICPDGIDSGMLGVTRYVRLPEGYNTKAKKVALNNGEIFKCRMILWQPETKINIDLFAKSFEISLAKIKLHIQNKEISFITDHTNHPIWTIITCKEQLEQSKYMISCPWQYNHTSQEDTGTFLIINSYGRLGFKCHHGHCAHRDTKYFLAWLQDFPVVMAQYNQYCLELAKQNLEKPCPIKITKGANK